MCKDSQSIFVLFHSQDYWHDSMCSVCSLWNENQRIRKDKFKVPVEKQHKSKFRFVLRYSASSGSVRPVAATVAVPGLV